MKKTSGITLIALVVTIVILIILATISINAVFGENGLIKMAEKAKVINAIKEKEEEVQFAIADLLLENNMDASKVTVSAVVDRVKQNYKDSKSKNSISGASNEEDSDNFPGYIQYDKPSSTIDQTIIVNVDENLNVSSKTEKTDEPIEIPDSEYEKVGNTYYNSPELNKFKPENTYYVTYDKDGKSETVYGRIDKVKRPDNWYDYENKKWANVVTVNGDDVTYWTWIPRYKYKITSGVQEVDVKFVDVNDQYKGNTEVDLTDYKLPESFTFDSTPLAGYWISKYEVQDSSSSGLEKIQAKVVGTSIYVTTTEVEKSGANSTDTYTIFLNGVKKEEGVTLPHYIEDLDLGTEYDVCLVNGTDKRMVGNIKQKTNDSSKYIEVDTSKFKKENTYYVTYDEEGKNETIYGRMDKVKEPDNWYNYDKKRWANVVTVNGDDVTYWTYIPRYEYIANSVLEIVDVRYIPVSQEEPDDGYKLPESFTFDEKQLKGYWISKYEVQDSSSDNLEKIQIRQELTSMYVTTTATKEGSKSTDTYTILLNGEKYEEKKNLPYNIENLEPGTEYEICLINETARKMVGAMTVKTNDTSKNIKVDLSGFKPECTYYVTYDEDGKSEQVCEKPISEMSEPPTNWYNYDKKRWANVVTKGKDETGKELIAYWTYIPRYEYKKNSFLQYTDVRYIPVSQEKADEGYLLPESFTFDGRQLAGYWISKYEVQE